MKNIIILLSLVTLFFGCTKDWGAPSTKNYSIDGPYTGLDVSCAFHVTMSDQVNDVVVTVGELAHDRVVVKVKDGTLYIGFKPHTRYNGEAVAVIPLSVLRDLDLSGASSFVGDLSGEEVDVDLSGASGFKGNVVANDLDMDLSGASSYNGDILVNKFDVDLSGASVAFVNGSCRNTMELELSGASQLKALTLDAPVVRGSMSGASQADVTCCTSLNVELSGASELTYGIISDDCKPVVNCPASGGSTVRPRF